MAAFIRFGWPTSVGTGGRLRPESVAGIAGIGSKVSDRATIWYNYDRMEEAYSCLLGNLCHADLLDAPVIYSRNSNAYIIERERYGYEFYTYGMIVGLIDAMYELRSYSRCQGKESC